MRHWHVHKRHVRPDIMHCAANAESQAEPSNAGPADANANAESDPGASGLYYDAMVGQRCVLGDVRRRDADLGATGEPCGQPLWHPVSDDRAGDALVRQRAVPDIQLLGNPVDRLQ